MSVAQQRKANDVDINSAACLILGYMPQLNLGYMPQLILTTTRHTHDFVECMTDSNSTIKCHYSKIRSTEYPKGLCFLFASPVCFLTSQVAGWSKLTFVPPQIAFGLACVRTRSGTIQTSQKITPSSVSLAFAKSATW